MLIVRCERGRASIDIIRVSFYQIDPLHNRVFRPNLKNNFRGLKPGSEILVSFGRLIEDATDGRQP